jgi:hypothetical protein
MALLGTSHIMMTFNSSCPRFKPCLANKAVDTIGLLPGYAQKAP